MPALLLDLSFDHSATRHGWHRWVLEFSTWRLDLSTAFCPEKANLAEHRGGRGLEGYPSIPTQISSEMPCHELLVTHPEEMQITVSYILELITAVFELSSSQLFF